MGKFIIQIKDKYFEWSTIVDAPVTFGMSHEELFNYIKREQGEQGLRLLPMRLERVNQKGTSAIGSTIDDLISGNRAGINENKLSIDEIYDLYTNVENYNKKMHSKKLNA